eukprot:5029994-Prymnesium_polylepis.1
MPFGPRLVRTVLASCLAASMFLKVASSSPLRCFEPSLSIPCMPKLPPCRPTTRSREARVPKRRAERLARGFANQRAAHARRTRRRAAPAATERPRPHHPRAPCTAGRRPPFLWQRAHRERSSGRHLALSVKV